ncbi:alpha/beta fold hydrolase [Nocardia sp. NPDC058058]|uniref:alpha/beta fold hydrolase n=1 Tax=Nocardia sp. NPDC058058 TaxID=3346317 RepID=UPI0036D8C7DE
MMSAAHARAAVPLLAVTMLAGCGTGGPDSPAAGGLPARFQEQLITWHDCRTGPEDVTGERLAAAGAQCGEFRAPVNYADPGGATISIAVARRLATDSVHRLGTLVVNTGGPGPSRDGVTMIVDGPEGGHPAAAAIAERFDLVGMDPRFFGASSPLDCGWGTGEYLGIAQAAPVDRESFDRTVATARSLAARCESSRALLPFASTRAIARDLDLLRVLLRESRISYLGWSWGTYLGAVYTQLFGDRVDRVVLDSALDPRAPGPDLTRDTATATAAALADWARWAALRDDEFGLGTTRDAVLEAVGGIADAVAVRPVTIGGVSITADMVPGLLLTVDDSDAYYEVFGRQVRALYDAALGHSSDPAPELEAKLALYADKSVSPEFGFSATVANQCAERSARGVEDYFTDIRAYRADEPMFGALARHLTPCAVWPVGPAEPATEISNGRPALLIGASGDPVAPVAGQRALRRALPEARMLVMEGAFRHGVYLAEPSRCIDSAVESYLLDGVLPGGDGTCRRVAD